MVLYLPNDGESPFEADKRISGEAFFPVKEQKLYFKNLEGKAQRRQRVCGILRSHGICDASAV